MVEFFGHHDDQIRIPNSWYLSNYNKLYLSEVVIGGYCGLLVMEGYHRRKEEKEEERLFYRMTINNNNNNKVEKIMAILSFYIHLTDQYRR